jgi:uncharacterized membrane protein YfcA|tara:strand:+ start:899 stop:1666 length:768 start_codon:yes stop_codon:yes gene_type:complete
MELTTIILSVLAGFLAGIINTIAGSGSIITLSLLTFLGLPANVANATNRVGLLFQSATGSVRFKQAGLLDVSSNWTLILTTTLGAILGAVLATKLDSKLFEKSVGVIFIGLLLVLIFKPEKRIGDSTILKKSMPIWMFLIGVYAGFIQAGAGIFMLAIMSVVWKKNITALNPIKVFIIFTINLVALAWYAYDGNVNWGIGLLLALGQFIGAFIGVKLNNTNKNIEPKLRVLLLGLVALSICKFLGIIELWKNYFL